MTVTTPLDGFIAGASDCMCGKEHTHQLKQLYVADSSCEELLPGLLEDYKANKIHFISSEAAMKRLGERVYMSLCSLGHQVSSSVFPEESGFICDHVSAGDLLIHTPHDAQLLIAVGDKTVCDLAKFVSSKERLPLIFLPVSASSDTFSMPYAEFTENDHRTRIRLTAPEIIVADISVLRDAPSPDTGAGVSCILADLVSLSDWDLSSKVTGSYICPKLSDELSAMCRSILRKIENGLSPREPSLMSELMTCLVASGIITEMAGTTAPVRGSESDIARHVENILVSEDITDVSFETLRGIAALYSVRMYEYLKRHTPSFEEARSGFSGFDSVYFNKELFRVFGDSEGFRILSSFDGDNYYRRESRFLRLDLLAANLNTFLGPIWDNLPSSSRMTSLLRSMSVPVSFREIGLSAEEITDVLVWSKELSGRYGIARLLSDLLMLELCSCDLNQL